MARVKIPKIDDTVWISSQRWTIEIVPPWDGGTMGDCDARRRRIRISADQTPEVALDTLMHELIHAMWIAHGGRTGDDSDEGIAYTLAPALLDLFRSNEWLVDVIKFDAQQVRRGRAKT